MKEKPVIINDESIGVIPVYKNNKGDYLFLIVLHNAGHWAFPKGHQENGESKVETAHRELYEETGIRNIEINYQHIFSESYSFERDRKIYNKQVRRKRT